MRLKDLFKRFQEKHQDLTINEQKELFRLCVKYKRTGDDGFNPGISMILS